MRWYASGRKAAKMQYGHPAAPLVLGQSMLLLMREDDTLAYTRNRSGSSICELEVVNVSLMGFLITEKCRTQKRAAEVTKISVTIAKVLLKRNVS